MIVRWYETIDNEVAILCIACTNIIYNVYVDCNEMVSGTEQYDRKVIAYFWRVGLRVKEGINDRKDSIIQKKNERR